MFKPLNTKKGIKRTFCFSVLLFVVAVVSVVFAAMAAERSGMYWADLDVGVSEKVNNSNRGFLMVDVSDLLSTSGLTSEYDEEESEVVPIGIGPLPSVPSLTTQELKLYGILSKGDGLISSEDASLLDGDIHWQEVVLEEGDTVESIAREYGISAADIRKANAMAPKQRANYSEVLYVPDSHDDVSKTLAFVHKLQRAELAESRQTKPLSITAYIVKDGDSLWAIANTFNLDLDTIVGSNKLKDINMLKLGTTLRIPNQDGIFVKIGKNGSLSAIANKYGSSKEAAMIANGLDEHSVISPGREIFLPGAKVVAVVESGGRRASRSIKSDFIVSGSRKFRWPVMGKISSSFGWRRSPFGKRRVFHAGLDIRAPRGRTIVAAGDGRIVHSGWMGGYGRTIVIAHSNGHTTLYGHCSRLLARSGARVNRGQIIAQVGSTGRSTGNHLHFEVRKNGTPMNPIRFLR